MLLRDNILATLNSNNYNFRLEHILYRPDLKGNALSVSNIAENGNKIVFMIMVLTLLVFMITA